jgi:hypothetical protein
MKIKLFMILAFMAALPGCSELAIYTDVHKGLKNFVVWLDPKPAQSTVKITNLPQGWNKKNKKDGYVGYAKGESGMTFFGVKQKNLGGSCNKGTADWVITRLRLSAEGNTTTEKGSGFGSPQPEWLLDAFPDVDLSNGVLFEADKTQGVTFLPVYNANGQRGYKFIYYEVTLAKCEGELLLTTDPGWGNGGHR